MLSYKDKEAYFLNLNTHKEMHQTRLTHTQCKFTSPTLYAFLYHFQISSLERNVEETLCSLKFAQRVCKVELGPAARKIESGGHCENYS